MCLVLSLCALTVHLWRKSQCFMSCVCGSFFVVWILRKTWFARSCAPLTALREIQFEQYWRIDGVHTHAVDIIRSTAIDIFKYAPHEPCHCFSITDSYQFRFTINVYTGPHSDNRQFAISWDGHNKSDEQNSDIQHTQKMPFCPSFPSIPMNTNILFKTFSIHINEISSTHSI